MKAPTIPPIPTHFFGFQTQPTIVHSTEIQTLVANLIAAEQWFEVSPFPPDHWSLRVKAEQHPYVALLREQLQ